MLVLTRKSGEEIVIDGNIRVCVLNVQGSRVRIGIETPVGLKVIRSELAPPPKQTRSADFGWAI